MIRNQSEMLIIKRKLIITMGLFVWSLGFILLMGGEMGKGYWVEVGRDGIGKYGMKYISLDYLPKF